MERFSVLFIWCFLDLSIFSAPIPFSAAYDFSDADQVWLGNKIGHVFIADYSNQSAAEENRVLNGKNISANKEEPDYAHMVASIASYYDVASEGVLCAGVLIGSKTVLTVAHCVVDLPKTNSTVRVSIGSEYRIDQIKSKVYRVMKKHIHPDFNTETKMRNLESDLAILELERDIPQPENMYMGSSTDNMYVFYPYTKVLGWGKNGTKSVKIEERDMFSLKLQQGDMQSWSYGNEACADAYSGTDINVTKKEILCASGIDAKPIGPCGDDGGPLFSNGYYLVGISVYSPCTSSELVFNTGSLANRTALYAHKPALFARAPYFYKFVDKVAESVEQNWVMPKVE